MRWNAPRALRVIFCFALVCSGEVVADGTSALLQGARGEGAVGSLRTVGQYPGDRGRIGQTVTALAGGGVFVYGAVQDGSTDKGELILDRRKRIYTGRSLMPEAESWNPERRGWVKHGYPPECQYGAYLQTATALPGGKILFAGGICDELRAMNDERPVPQTAYNKVSLWNAASQTWESLPPLVQGRAYHSATLLADGAVMIIGGVDDQREKEDVEPVFASVELYRVAADGHTAEGSPLPPLRTARAKHTATRTLDNRVIVVGGVGTANQALASVEIFDPRSGSWRDGSRLNTARYAHNAVLLDDGRLMVTGGINAAGKPISSVEIYDPSTDLWVEGPPLMVSLRTHSAVGLSSGDVLVIGTSEDEYQHTLARAMLWRKNTRQWQPAGVLRPDALRDIKDSETYHLLAQKDGGALVFGNRAIMQWSPAQTTTRSYFPESQRTAYSSAVLPNGQILLAGGRTGPNPTTLAELYDPVSNRFSLTGSMLQARYTGMPFQSSLSSVVLKNGKLVVAGGWVASPGDPDHPAANSPDLWDPTSGQWSVISAIQFEAQDRVFFNALQDGRVLFFASRSNPEKGIAEFHAWSWNPENSQVVRLKPSATARDRAGIAVLPDGRVLIVGGQRFSYYAGFQCPRSKTKRVQPVSDEEGDECRDEPAGWSSFDEASAEVWDSGSGISTPLKVPERLRGQLPQTLVLKNGDVVVLNTEPASPYGHARPLSPLLWSSRTQSFSALPPLDSNINWPMTELNDGSLIAWAPENINPANAMRLKPGATAWEPMPRFPQTKATAITLPSGQLLALASSAPHVAAWDEKAFNWRLLNNAYLHVMNPALVELDDHQLAVIGTIFGNKIAVQTWDQASDRWKMMKVVLGDRSSTGKALRLPSGAVMHFSHHSGGAGVACDIWRPSDDSWKYCGLFKPEKKNVSLNFALGALEDGRAVFVSGSEVVNVYDEATASWKPMKAEWNTEAYRYGEAVRSDKPIARFFDPDKNAWIDGSEVGGKYMELSRGGQLAPAMLWDRKLKRWAYISQFGLGRNAAWLPDGCAISGLPFKIYNPASGKIRELSEPVTGLELAAMTVLHDGTVVAIGSNQAASEAGSEVFRRKASCAGFESYPGDLAFMPGIYAGPVAALAPPTVSVASPKPGSTLAEQFSAAYESYRWVALAILLPLFTYLLIRGGTRWFARRYPDSALLKPVGKTAANRSAFFVARVVIYGLALALALPNLIGYLALRASNTAEQCHALPMDNGSSLPRSQQIDACLGENAGFFTRIFSGIGKTPATLPCRFVGIWSSSMRGLPNRVSLQADGKYFFEEGGISSSDARPVVGHWEVQGQNMVWHHARMEGQPDVNKILKQTDTGFSLLEQNGQQSDFELIKRIQSERCSE